VTSEDCVMTFDELNAQLFELHKQLFELRGQLTHLEHLAENPAARSTAALRYDPSLFAFSLVVKSLVLIAQQLQLIAEHLHTEKPVV